MRLLFHQLWMIRYRHWKGVIMELYEFIKSFEAANDEIKNAIRSLLRDVQLPDESRDQPLDISHIIE